MAFALIDPADRLRQGGVLPYGQRRGVWNPAEERYYVALIDQYADRLAVWKFDPVEGSAEVAHAGSGPEIQGNVGDFLGREQLSADALPGSDLLYIAHFLSAAGEDDDLTRMGVTQFNMEAEAFEITSVAGPVAVAGGAAGGTVAEQFGEPIHLALDVTGVNTPRAWVAYPAPGFACEIASWDEGDGWSAPSEPFAASVGSGDIRPRGFLRTDEATAPRLHLFAHHEVGSTHALYHRRLDLSDVSRLTPYTSAAILRTAHPWQQSPGGVPNLPGGTYRVWAAAEWDALYASSRASGSSWSLIPQIFTEQELPGAVIHLAGCQVGAGQRIYGVFDVDGDRQVHRTELGETWSDWVFVDEAPDDTSSIEAFGAGGEVLVIIDAPGAGPLSGARSAYYLFDDAASAGEQSYSGPGGLGPDVFLIG